MEILHLEKIGPIAEVVQKLGAIATVITLVFALLQCFFGYKLLRAWIALIGFLVGFFLGLIISGKFGATGYLPLIIAIIAGILMAILSFKVYLVGVFIYCGVIAAGATMLIPYPEGGAWTVIGFVIAVAAFVAAGFLAVKFAKPCIIGISAISGASSAVQALRKLLPEVAKSQNLALLIFIGLIGAGVAVQVLMNRGK